MLRHICRANFSRGTGWNRPWCATEIAVKPPTLTWMLPQQLPGPKLPPVVPSWLPDAATARAQASPSCSVLASGRWRSLKTLLRSCCVLIWLGFSWTFRMSASSFSGQRSPSMTSCGRTTESSVVVFNQNLLPLQPSGFLVVPWRNVWHVTKGMARREDESIRIAQSQQPLRGAYLTWLISCFEFLRYYSQFA